MRVKWADRWKVPGTVPGSRSAFGVCVVVSVARIRRGSSELPDGNGLIPSFLSVT